MTDVTLNTAVAGGAVIGLVFSGVCAIVGEFWPALDPVRGAIIGAASGRVWWSLSTSVSPAASTCPSAARP
jgi:hypothetical protein